MGLLSFLQQPTTLNLVRLPNGSFTVDSDGEILVTTLPGSFPQGWAAEIGRQVLATFRAAQEAELPLKELVAEFSALKLTARALRGGAIIFLAPQGLGRK
jgi:hypothetical protein